MLASFPKLAQSGVQAQAVSPAAGQRAGEAVSATAAEIRRGREMLQTKKFAEAKSIFTDYLKAHPGDEGAELGLGDAELGLRQYEAAELTYRGLVAREPELWQAHKNLVVVEAALGRWEDFDGERKILRLARERGAAGISTRESDVIDGFSVHGERWIVRAYFEPVGRSRTIYNFEQFGVDGRVRAYISLEDAAAAAAALHPGDVRIGGGASGGASPSRQLALNWYTGAAHGTLRRYPSEPRYEGLRSEVFRWLRRRPASVGDKP